MKLRKKQREAVLGWIAEGLQTDEINKLAAKFKPPFKVLRSQVDYYRKTRDFKLDEIKEADEESALKKGLAIKENRVAVLERLANRMIADLMPELLSDSLVWVSMSKTVANERYDYREFNRAEVDALRGVLDDIAAEIGQRVRKSDVTSNGKPIGQPTTDLKALRKQLSDEQLAVLEEAATVLEQAERDSAAAEPEGD